MMDTAPLIIGLRPAGHSGPTGKGLHMPRPGSPWTPSKWTFRLTLQLLCEVDRTRVTSGMQATPSPILRQGDRKDTAQERPSGVPALPEDAEDAGPVCLFLPNLTLDKALMLHIFQFCFPTETPSWGEH